MELKRVLSKKNMYLLFLCLILIISYFFMQNINIANLSNSIENDNEIIIEVDYNYEEKDFNNLYKEIFDDFSFSSDKEKFIDNQEIQREKLSFFENIYQIEYFQKKHPEQYKEGNMEEGKKILFSEYSEFVGEYEKEKELIILKDIYLERVVIESFLRQNKYINQYPESIVKIQKSAEQMLSFPGFSKEGSFSKDNILKTVKDFKKVENTKPELINGSALKHFIDFSLVDFAIITFLIYIIFLFMEERKKGLWTVIHSTKNGRTNITMKRAGLLGLFSIISSIFMYGIIIILSVYRYGPIDNLFAPIQSVEVFAKSVLNINILSYFILYIFLKACIIFVFALCIYVIVSLINQVLLGVLLSILFIGLQYIFYAFIWPQSSVNFLKYINFFSLLDLRKSTSSYININFFSKAINLLTVEVVVFFFITICSLVLIILISKYKKPTSNSFKMPTIFDNIYMRFSKKSSYLNMLWMEFYKTLRVQKGFIVFVVLFILICYLPKEENIIYSENQVIENSFYEEFYGELSEEKISIMNKIISSDSSSDSEQKAFMKISEQVNHLTEIKTKNEIDVWILNPNGFSVLFAEKNINFTRNNMLYLIVFLVVLFSGINSYENQSNMITNLKTTKNGRLKVKKYKMIMSVILIFLMLFILESYQFLYIKNTFGLKGFQAPIQSLSLFKNFPLTINIYTFMVLLFIVKLLMSILITLIIYFISSKAQNHKQSIIYSSILLIVPSALFITGIDFIKPFSIIFYINVIEWIKLFF